jgi:toxin CcdB
VRQFDIVENLIETSRKQYPFLLILQHDRVTSLQSVIVAPLVRRQAAAAGTKLHPAVTISGEMYLLLAEELAATPRAVLGRVVTSAEDQRYAIVSAIDLLFTGI